MRGMRFRILILLPWMIGNATAQVDLHAHLYMDQGMGPAFLGTSKSAPRAHSSESRLESKASEMSLVSPGSARITVVSLYAHPWLSSPLNFQFRENISSALDREYLELQRFLNLNSTRFALARNAFEARNAINSGKKVLVLSLEGAFGGLESEKDFKKWVDDRGLALLGPFHLTEDYFGGTAFMSPALTLLTSPLALLESILLSGGSCLKHGCTSPVGIKPEGRNLIDRALERQVWIDMAHANRLERSELLPEFRKRGLPLLVSHTMRKEIYPFERSLSEEEIEYLQSVGGIVGLIPSDDYFKVRNQGTCFSGIVEFKKEIQLLEARVGKHKVMVGSDLNAPLKGLSPVCTVYEGMIFSKIETSGFFSQNQLKALYDYVSPDPEWVRKTEESFLAAWEKVRPH